MNSHDTCRKPKFLTHWIPTPPFTFASDMPPRIPLHKPPSFILVFCPQQPSPLVCSLGPVPMSMSRIPQPSPLLPDWFSHSPRPLPETTAMQLSPVSFTVGMRDGLLRLRIELWERWECIAPTHSDRMNSQPGGYRQLVGMCQWHLGCVCARKTRCSVDGINWTGAT